MQLVPVFSRECSSVTAIVFQWTLGLRYISKVIFLCVHMTKSPKFSYQYNKISCSQSIIQRSACAASVFDIWVILGGWPAIVPHKSPP